jgi:hypothetical protein
LEKGEWCDTRPVIDVAGRDVVSVTPANTVNDALDLMLEEEVDHLPVIDGGQMVGICTRTDVMRARRPQLASERPEPGWRLGRWPGTASRRTDNGKSDDEEHTGDTGSCGGVQPGEGEGT